MNSLIFNEGVHSYKLFVFANRCGCIVEVFSLFRSIFTVSCSYKARFYATALGVKLIESVSLDRRKSTFDLAHSCSMAPFIKIYNSVLRWTTNTQVGPFCYLFFSLKTIRKSLKLIIFNVPKIAYILVFNKVHNINHQFSIFMFSI